MAEEKQGIVIVPVDFSKEEVARAVLTNVAGSPLVTIPVALGGVGFVAIFALGAPIWLTAPLLLGVGVFGFNYFVRRDSIAVRYLQEFNAATRDQSKKMASYLMGEFTELGFDRGKQQIELLQKHLATIKKLLEEKFDKGDVSYEQFLGPAESLVAKTLNILKDAAAQLRANQTHDTNYDRSASKVGAGNGNVDRRKELYDEGTRYFEGLIEQVESAITGLAELTHDVARIGSDAGTHSDYIQRVREVASRAGLYVDEKRI